MKLSTYLEASVMKKDVPRAMQLIIAILNRRTGENFEGGKLGIPFERGGETLTGYTFYSGSKAVRFNFKDSAGSSEIVSVDIWLKPKFNSDLTARIRELRLNNVQTVNLLTQMLDGKKGTVEIEDSAEVMSVKEDYINQIVEMARTKGAYGKEKKHRIAQGLPPEEEKIKRPVGRPALGCEVNKSDPETLKILEKMSNNPLFGRMGVGAFQQMESVVNSVIKGRRTGCLLVGDSGVGKSYTVLQELDKSKVRYEEFKGSIKSATNLFSILYDNNDANKILVFDDCDSVLEDAEQTEILKGALDDKDKRIIAYVSKSLMTPLEYVEHLMTTGKAKEAREYAASVKLDQDPKIKLALIKGKVFVGESEEVIVNQTKDILNYNEDELEGLFEARKPKLFDPQKNSVATAPTQRPPKAPRVAPLPAADGGDGEDEGDGADEEGETKMKIRQLSKLPYPQKFAFVGRCIFISNHYLSNIPAALRTRLNPVELNLNPEEVLDRIKDVKIKVKGATQKDIDHVWDFIKKEVSEYLNKMDFRSFENAVKTYLDTDGAPVWKKWTASALYNSFGKGLGYQKGKR